MPSTFTLYSIIITVVTCSTLFTLNPATCVFTTIFPNKATLTMPFVFLELSYILFAVRPNQMTMSMHFIIEPVSVELLIVWPNINTPSLNFIHVELPFVNRSVCECKFSPTVLLSFWVVSFIDCSVRPSFNASFINKFIFIN